MKPKTCLLGVWLVVLATQPAMGQELPVQREEWRDPPMSPSRLAHQFSMRHELNYLLVRWLESLQRRELDRLPGLYAPDARLTLPGGRSVNGTPAIVEFWASTTPPGPAHIVLEDVRASDGLATVVALLVPTDRERDFAGTHAMAPRSGRSGDAGLSPTS